MYLMKDNIDALPCPMIGYHKLGGISPLITTDSPCANCSLCKIHPFFPPPVYIIIFTKAIMRVSELQDFKTDYLQKSCLVCIRINWSRLSGHEKYEEEKTIFMLKCLIKK